MVLCAVIDSRCEELCSVLVGVAAEENPDWLTSFVAATVGVRTVLGEMKVVLVVLTATSVPLNIRVSSVEISSVAEKRVEGVFSSIFDSEEELESIVPIT